MSNPRSVHSVRFFAPPPSSAHCLAYCVTATGNQQRLIALSRANNDIEIWNVTATPFLWKWIPGNSESSVEALVWAGDRLFSTGLHGLVLEHDLDTLGTRQKFAVTSGPAWCMSYHAGRNRVAVGTEEGYVCLFEVTEEGLVYDKVLDKQEGRIMCLAWHVTGDYIVTGSSDTLRFWDVSSGHPTTRMTTGRTEKRKETIVWSVAIADDFTVISGDSRGKTCFWNGKLGTLIDAYQTHKADVLAVAINQGQDVAYSSGVDPWIMHFQPVVRKNGRSKWVKSLHRWVHTHDVRAIVTAGAKIFSAGVDASLAVNDLPSRSLNMYPPFPHGDCIVVAAEARMVVLRYPKYLEVWKLGKAAAAGEVTIGSILPLEAEPVKLLHLQTKDDETIRTCSIASDGSWIAYATPTRLRVYKLVEGEERVIPTLRRASLRSAAELQLAHHLAFYRNNKKNADWHLVSATENGGLQFFDLSEDEKDGACCKVTLQPAASTLCKKTLGLTRGISHLAIGEEEVCALADYTGTIVSVDLRAKRVLAQMPLYQSAPVTCLSVKGDNLVAAYSDHHVVECNLRTGKYTKAAFQLGRPWTSKKFATRGIVQQKERLILYDDVMIAVLDRRDNESAAKRQKDGEAEKGTTEMNRAVKFTKKYEHLVHFSSLSDSHELVAVEVRPQVIEELLPPSLRQKKFGAM